MSKKVLLFSIISVVLLGSLVILSQTLFLSQKPKNVLSAQKEQSYWFVLERKSNKEYLYLGDPGVKTQSKLVKIFQVKSGIPGERPTPLPQIVGQKYWLITAKSDTHESLETAPYFLTLNIPAPSEAPFGPSPYNECNGQCNWVLPGAFGLHGVAGDTTRLSAEDPGSSGCIRHSDEDITYLYNLLDPQRMEIRYYVEDI